MTDEELKTKIELAVSRETQQFRNSILEEFRGLKSDYNETNLNVLLVKANMKWVIGLLVVLGVITYFSTVAIMGTVSKINKIQDKMKIENVEKEKNGTRRGN